MCILSYFKKFNNDRNVNDKAFKMIFLPDHKLNNKRVIL